MTQVGPGTVPVESREGTYLSIQPSNLDTGAVRREYLYNFKLWIMHRELYSIKFNNIIVEPTLQQLQSVKLKS
jgi:hypothetical protein